MHFFSLRIEVAIYRTLYVSILTLAYVHDFFVKVKK